jgi:predicted transcriptional regulator
MNLIISIKPQFVEKILSGEKKYEFRRRIYRKSIEKIYIYQTSPDAKIVGYFKPGKIIKDTPENLWNEFSDVSGTTKDSLLTYLHDKDEAYAIEITDLVIFETPIKNEDIPVPQSYQYIDFDLR